MHNKNCYTILGVRPNASFKEIKSQYRLLAKKFHPDKNPGNTAAEENFKEIQHAYAVLSNLEKRKLHDLKFSGSEFTGYKKQYTPYNGNAYQYAQQQAQGQAANKKPCNNPIAKPAKQYRTEIYQLIISIIIALLLLYFIISF